MKRCRIINHSGGIYVVRLDWKGKSLHTFIGAHNEAEADREAQRRLDTFMQGGVSEWYDVTPEEIAEAVEAFNKSEEK